MTPTLDAYTTSKATLIVQAAAHIAALIDNHETISRATLNAAMTRAFGVSDSSGAWSQRDSFEMLEQALVLSLLKRDPLPDPAQELAALEKITRALPTQSIRSEDQMNFQQFSTPAPLAWLAGQAARIEASDIFLEPSAGTGLLAVAASRAGARNDDNSELTGYGDLLGSPSMRALLARRMSDVIKMIFGEI